MDTPDLAWAKRLDNTLGEDNQEATTRLRQSEGVMAEPDSSVFLHFLGRDVCGWKEPPQMTSIHPFSPGWGLEWVWVENSKNSFESSISTATTWVDLNFWEASLPEKMLYFNGIDVDTGDYYHPPMAAHQFESELEFSVEPDPIHSKGLASWANCENLAESGWGVIIAEGEDPRIVDAIGPLLSLRKEQTGQYYKSYRFLKQDRLHFHGFFDRFHMNHADVDPELAPYYLMIVGSPESIPFEFQYQLDVNFGVGRICFDTVAEYEIYVTKVVESERELLAAKRSMVFFGAENDPLTHLSTRAMVKPLSKKLKELLPTWEVETVSGPQASKKRLKGLIGGSETPAFLFTAGHGLMCSRDTQRRSLEQGSLICSDWGGPGSQISRSHYFGPNDVNFQNDCRGSILFHFACFTSGTPQFCGFSGMGQRRRLHAKPFVAPLAQRMLAHRWGPLAVVGHVDQAFQYSFLWNDQIHEISHFASAFHQLAGGLPIGAAMEPFNRRFASIGAQILDEMIMVGPTAQIRTRYWMGFNDARNYLVLGDPAVRLNPRPLVPNGGVG